MTRLFGIAACFCLAPILASYPAEVQRTNEELITLIRNHGGTAEIDDTKSNKPIVRVRLAFSTHPTTNEDLVFIKDLVSLRSLVVSGSSFNGNTLVFCKGLPDLEELILFNANIKDEDIVNLEKLTKLRALNLSGTPLTDKGLKSIHGLSNLARIDISRTRVTDNGLVHFRQLVKLQNIRCIETKITDAALINFANMREIRHLSLDGTPVSGKSLKGLMLDKLEELGMRETEIAREGLEIVKSCSQLQKLRIGGRNIVDDDLAGLVELSKLEDLYIEAKIGDKSMAAIGRIKALKQLSLVSTDVSSFGVAELTMLPALRGLMIRKTEIDVATLRRIAAIAKLESLNLDSTGLLDSGVPFLKSMVGLRELSLSGNPISDIALQVIAELPALEHLHINDTKITNRGLKYLQNLKNLQRLSALGTKVTEEGEQELKKGNPLLIVSFDRQ